MENFCIKTCRTCNKENFVFCDIYHEIIQKILKYIPNLLNINDETLLSSHITKICTSCYQMMKTIIYQIEGIIDIQKILKIEHPSTHSQLIPQKIMKSEAEVERKSFRAEDIARKFTNIKVRKVSICSKTPEKLPSREEAINETLIVIDPLSEVEIKKPRLNESPQKMLMCISCSEKFTDFNLLQAHLKSCKAPASNNLKCFCGKILNSKKDLAFHVYSEHKQNKRKHICTICKKIFTSLFNLQNHMAVHQSNAPIKGTFWCQYCDVKFSEPELLKKHRELTCKSHKKTSEA